MCWKQIRFPGRPQQKSAKTNINHRGHRELSKFLIAGNGFGMMNFSIITGANHSQFSLKIQMAVKSGMLEHARLTEEVVILCI